MSKLESALVSSSSFDEFNNSVQMAALKATKHALLLPSDLSFHRSMDTDVAECLDELSTRVLAITNTLLTLASTSQTARRLGDASLEGQDDVVDRFQYLVIDAMDHLLEQADMNLDIHSGAIKLPAIANNPAISEVQKKTTVPRGRLNPALQYASHLAKPQLKFKKPVDNQNQELWHPMLLHKFNAKVPLGYNFRDSDSDAAPNSHPYQYEIRNITYPERMFQPSLAQQPKSFEETPFTWVDTPALLEAMLSKLRAAKEIAVDLEHHSYRSWSGFLCLMQISTRTEDFVIDTLLLRDELQELNEIFTNSEIVKVFHGAESDIVWLQKDFNLYTVNLFDTFHASKLLEFPRHGLANLLSTYCDFTPDKRYQLADWRIRPLPEEMLLYARSDTHFLLYIYDNLKNALLDRGNALVSQDSPNEAEGETLPDALIRQVLSRSAETSLRTYEREFYDADAGSGPGGWDNLARKWNKIALTRNAPESLEKNIYKRLHSWRDRVARQEDESRTYVLQNNYLFQLAEQPAADLPALLTKFKIIPPVIKRRAKELLDTIKFAIHEHNEHNERNEPVAMAGALNSDGGIVKSTSRAKTVPTTIFQADDTPRLSPKSLESRLWNRKAEALGIVLKPASGSSLFALPIGTPRIKVLQGPQPYCATTSSLFKRKSTPLLLEPTTSLFQEVVSRIHRNLVIAPSAPSTAPSPLSADLNTAAAVAISEHQNPPESSEMAFVPATQRRLAEVVDDSIVIVGQARQKKRKRNKASNQELTSESIISAMGDTVAPNKPKRQKASEGRDADISEELFDYASVPNMLDNVSTLQPDLARKKKKQKKGGPMQYGDFPTPPRAHRETQGGNQSYTFK